ncbi:MAG TPA: glutamate--tRNA ligase, partial [Thermoanaerobacter sp.]|nr:glutamate--tRNA ligase [Thermoanaerobacter sp.]
WLFARHNGGKFILRVDDTDLQRSTEESMKGILEGLKWLGIDWDEGPIYQSQRLEEYRKFANKLLKEGKAYYCFCTKEEL